MFVIFHYDAYWWPLWLE